MNWTRREMIWYERALKFSGYPEKIIKFMKPMLRSNDTLMDLGCGIGTFALPFAALVKEVLAADIDPGMIGYLKERIAREKKENVKTLILDWCKRSEQLLQPVDIIFSAYSGKQITGCKESIKDLSSLASRYVFLLVAKERLRHSFQTEELFEMLGREHNRRRVNFTDLSFTLKEMGIKYSYEEITCDFGQPFSDFQEACEFFSFYYDIKQEDELKILHSFLNEKLEYKDGYLWIDNPKTGVLVWWET